MSNKAGMKVSWMTEEAQVALKAEADRRGLTQGELLAALIHEQLPLLEPVE